MRGEERLSTRMMRASRELPPHARRRALSLAVFLAAGGITSACAEKRSKASSYSGVPGNYLRMRGEEAPLLKATLYVGELPPHARRREVGG